MRGPRFHLHYVPPRFAMAMVLALWLTGCTQLADPARQGESLDSIARSYVRLVLALGEHDAAYVDAYYGPGEWREEARSAGLSLAAVRQQARDLLARLPALEPAAGEALEALRWRYLGRQLESLEARCRMLQGERLTFDEESQALYDAVAPAYGEERFESVLEALGERLAAEGFSEGSLLDRYNAFRAEFVIPPERVDQVFRTAIDACRERTARWIDLPEGESFEVEYVRDKSWSAYNWYKGGFHSLIQVNIDLPIHIDRAIDLACHEGYPGHHVYNALLEKHLVRDRDWVELSVYPLFSPQSLIAEGSANYGIEMAFPGEERIRFERRVLFPAAGLDPDRAEVYYEVQGLLEGLSHAGNQAARRYLDGEIDGEEAAAWLERYAAMSPQRARQRVRFMDDYRSYVINYNLGLDLVRAYIEENGGAGPEDRWQVFHELLSTPRLPSDLL